MDLDHLGAPLRPMARVPGKASSSVYRLDTDQGSYAVKQLSLDRGWTFDGAFWTPDPTAFPADVQSFDGTFTLQADGTGRFAANDGPAATFLRWPGCSC